MDLDADHETYLLLLLSDSNLPTGAFVASSGLESYVKHGFAPSASLESSVIAFLRASLESYARTALPFVSDAHNIATLGSSEEGDKDLERRADGIVQRLTELDGLYHSMTLNHVARRASMSQGVALLNLYAKGFSKPPSLAQLASEEQNVLGTVVDKYKRLIRREETLGHLPICWGILTAALGLSLARTQYLHLFLHARGLLSASVRLNDIGPYNSQQILLHVVRPLIVKEIEKCKDLRSGMLEEGGFDGTVEGPACTWPLGEILASRHDLQHSRIFNS